MRVLAGAWACGGRLAGVVLRPGPYHQWTRKINGKTVTRLLSDDQLADYQPCFDNQRRLRDLITELEALSQDLADKDTRWQR